jgi:DNA-binding IclR family transcriptional regulator
MPERERRQYLTDQGMRPFTRNTCTDIAAIEHELRSVRSSQPVIEHGQFRDSVSCAAGLVPRGDPDEPYWTVVVSVRGHQVRPEVNAALMRAAQDLATA